MRSVSAAIRMANTVYRGSVKIFEPNAVLTARRDWNDGLASFFVRPTSGSIVPFEPGQFTTLALPKSPTWGEGSGEVIRHAYSYASHPSEECYEFFVRRVDRGALTPKLFALAVGDPVWIDERASGKFTLAQAPDAPELVLIGTGTGVAPFRPMILDAGTERRFPRRVLVYGARYVADLAYAEEFSALAARDSSFVFLPTVTDPDVDATWSGFRGRVQALLEPDLYRASTGHALSPERCQVYLCGNPRMIEEVQSLLEGLGFKQHRSREPGQIHTEKYW